MISIEVITIITGNIHNTFLSVITSAVKSVDYENSLRDVVTDFSRCDGSNKINIQTDISLLSQLYLLPAYTNIFFFSWETM